MSLTPRKPKRFEVPDELQRPATGFEARAPAKEPKEPPRRTRTVTFAQDVDDTLRLEAFHQDRPLSHIIDDLVRAHLRKPADAYARKSGNAAARKPADEGTRKSGNEDDEPGAVAS